MQNQLVEFVKDKKGRRVGCVVAVKMLGRNGPCVFMGWSKCMTRASKEVTEAAFRIGYFGDITDTFNRQMALDKAIGRAEYTRHHDCYVLSHDNEKYKLNDGVPSLVCPVIRRMAKRAAKYFRCPVAKPFPNTE